MYLQASRYFELSYNFKPLIFLLLLTFFSHLLPDKSVGKFLLSLSKRAFIDNTFYTGARGWCRLSSKSPSELTSICVGQAFYTFHIEA